MKKQTATRMVYLSLPLGMTLMMVNIEASRPVEGPILGIFAEVCKTGLLRGCSLK